MADSTPLHVVWLDASVYNDANKALLTKISEINSNAREFNDETECVRLLGRGFGDSRRFIFIVSGALGEKVVPELQEHENILSIYIYCQNESKHKAWSKDYRKVTVVTTTDQLLQGLRIDQDRFR